MTQRLLTIDLGNSRCKLRVWRTADGRRTGREGSAEFEGGERLAERMGSWLRAQEPIDIGAISSVAAPALEERVRGVASSYLRSELLEEPDPGLRVQCDDTAAVGRDRLYAARGALEALDRSAIVVDAGTALTVDVVLRHEDAGGRFLGGAIAPGPELLAKALAAGAANLFLVSPQPGDAALGKSTEAALRAGIVHGFRGAARELVEGVARAAGGSRLPVALTGGARGFLLSPEPFTEREVAVQPDLVHLGLVSSLLDARAESAPTGREVS